MDALTTVGNAGSQAAPFVVEIVEKLPEVAPIVIRNAEGAVKVGKTALNIAKGGAMLFGTGLLIGTGTALVLGGAATSFWAIGSLGGFINKKWKARQERLAREEAVKAAMGVATPSPA